MRLSERQVGAVKTSSNGGSVLVLGYKNPGENPSLEDLESIEDNYSSSPADSTLPSSNQQQQQEKDCHHSHPHHSLPHPSPEQSKMGKGGNGDKTSKLDLVPTQVLIPDKMPAVEVVRGMDTILECGDGSVGSKMKLAPVKPSRCQCLSKGAEKEEEKEEVLQGRHLVEKMVFVLSIVTLLLLAYCLVTVHWLLPYYFTVSLPFLIIIRIIMYWKYKWQYFLIDLCYFGNIITLIYIWAVPDNGMVFCVCFGLSVGPLAWAVPVFRNSLVFHSTDKMTSAYIHFLPLLLTYIVRWFPASVSLYWYKPFISSHNEDIAFIFIWVVSLPFAFFVLHNLCYLLFVFVIMRPGPEYLYTYSYLSENKIFRKVFTMCGPKYKGFLFYAAMYLYTALTLLLGVLLYKFFIAHTLFVAMCFILALWNGASFYLDVFAYKGYKAET